MVSSLAKEGDSCVMHNLIVSPSLEVRYLEAAKRDAKDKAAPKGGDNISLSLSLSRSLSFSPSLSLYIYIYIYIYV